jgi:hypothetical protein
MAGTCVEFGDGYVRYVLKQVRDRGKCEACELVIRPMFFASYSKR